ncbi:MAG: hypothetical protein RJQ09_18555 [Cyclobacteriaceae bacterium]
MSKHKLDSTFKKKLENVEVVPSAAAFQKFEGQLTEKKGGYIWLKVAASITILTVVAWAIFISNTNEPQLADVTMPLEGSIDEETQIASNKIEPTNIETIVEDKSPAALALDDNRTVEQAQIVPEIEAIQKPIEGKESERKALKPMVADVTDAAVDLMEEYPDIVIAEPVELEETLIADNSASIEEEKELPAVKIIYKRGKKSPKTYVAEAQQPTDSISVKNGGFNKIINSAKSLTDGSLIASLRDAKDDFFNKND